MDEDDSVGTKPSTDELQADPLIACNPAALLLQDTQWLQWAQPSAASAAIRYAAVSYAFHRFGSESLSLLLKSANPAMILLSSS